MQPTTLKYMDHQYLYTDTAKVIGQDKTEDGRDVLFLNQTILYPQGGGQKYDTGLIKSDNAQMQVQEVRFLDGLVYHIGKINGSFNAGETVNLKVDETRRQLSSKLHTAGHLIDEAVNNLGITWQATKGCHFEGQSSVEYDGNLEEGRDYVGEIEKELNSLIEKGFETKAFFADRSELEDICHFVLPDMPKDKPTRVVIVWGKKGIPCGGTHVKNINEVGPVHIRKVKAKKGTIKVSYDLQNM